VVAARMDNRFGTNFGGLPRSPSMGPSSCPASLRWPLLFRGTTRMDLLTNDIGLVVMCTPEGELEGFNIYVSPSPLL